MKRRILAGLLCIGLLLSEVSFPVSAAVASDEVTNGTVTAGTIEGDDKIAKKTLFLTYDANASDVTSMPENGTYQYAESVTISEIKPVREGYIFVGWNSAADGYGDIYVSGEKFQITEDLMLYAVWEETVILTEAVQLYINTQENSGNSEILAVPNERDTVNHAVEKVVNTGSSSKNAAQLGITYFSQYNKSQLGQYFATKQSLACGVSCSAMVASWYGLDATAYTTEQIIKRTGGSANVSVNNFRREDKIALNFIGKDTNAKTQNQMKEELDKSINAYLQSPATNAPPIVSIYNKKSDGISNHYVLVIGKEGTNYIIIDPATEGRTNLFWVATQQESSRNNSGYSSQIKSITTFTRKCGGHYDNTQDGKCDNCNAWMPNKPEGVSPTNGEGIYQIIENNVCLRPYPYPENSLVTIPVNTEVNVTGAVKNSLDKIWYIVEFAGQIGYIFPSQLKYKRAFPQPVPQVTISGLTIPTNHVQGNSFKISGTITATQCKITGVQAWFVDATGNKLCEISKVSCNKTSFSLYGSEVDNRLKFGKLSPGQYKYVVYVTTDTSKTEIAESNWFTVVSTSSQKAQSVPAAPTLSAPTPFIGGNSYTISQSTNGVKLYYSLDNGANYAEAQGNSVTVQITNTTTIKAYSGQRANEQAWAVQIHQLSTPEIYSAPNASGSVVQIAAEQGSSVYYKIGSGQFAPYTGAFTVTSGCTVVAYAEKSGYITSNTASRDIPVYVPDTPSITRDTAEHIADGDAISVHWGSDIKAGSYVVNIYKGDQIWKTDETVNCQYTFVTDGVATYKITVSARNSIGTSAVSNSVAATTHAPSTVTFKDYDGTILSSQSVKYGGSAVKPATPVRRGYTFAGWNGGYNNVLNDVTITADYEINVYTVRFYDVDGSTPIGTQDITFDEGIDAEAMKNKVTIANGGRIFTGWYIFYTKEDDSHLDLEHVDSDMSVRAVTSWANEDLPVYIDDVSAIISYGATSNVFNGYHVSCKISTTEAKDMKFKLIVTLLSKAEGGVYKMVNTKTDVIHMTADKSNYPWEGDITCDGSNKADRVEVSVVAIDGLDRTGGLLAEAKYCDIQAAASVFWSDWLTAEQLAAVGRNTSEADVESKVQYSARENKRNVVNSSSATVPAGYSLLSDNSYWGEWNRTTSYIASSSTRQVQTTTERVSSGYTQYRYGAWRNANGKRHFCMETGKSLYGGSWYTTYTDWSTTQYAPDKSMTWGYCPTTSHSHVGYNQYTNGKYYWTHYTINGLAYYWEESQWVDTSYDRTWYSYRDYVGSYTYYKWDDGAWSDWTDEVLVDSDPSDRSYEVQTRNMYRYKVYDASLLTTDTSGTVRSITGSLNDTALSGRKATIMVYKSKNTDPTESQLEYVGQTTLDGNGGYNFRFITKEEPSVDTYDFVVALAVEGSDSLVNVDMVRYERSTYTVTFTADDTVVETQEIYEGESARVPDAPEKEGHIFTGWSKNTTNVTKNITAVAKYKPQSYCVAFVDYLNQSCTLTRADYNSNVTIPEALSDREYEGYIFGGWDLSTHPVVDGDIVITAIWTPVEYTVNFYDADNKVLESQKVAYGQAAVPPASIHNTADKNFLGWSDDYSWWNVKSDIDVYPIMAYNKSVAAISANVSYYEEGLNEEVELYAEDGATIYFTLDGTTPDPEAAIRVAATDYVIPEFALDISEDGEDMYSGTTYIYTEPIPINVSADVTAIACKDGYEDSSVFYHTFEYTEEIADETDYGSVVELVTRDVTVQEGDVVTLEIALTKDLPLAGTMLVVEADPTVFSPIYDADLDGIRLYAGTLNEGNGEVYFEGYDEENGLLLLWLGNSTIEGTGSLFKLDLYAGDIEKAGTYPITIKYATTYTYDEDFCPVRLEDAIGLTVSKNGSMVVNKAGMVISEVIPQVYTGTAIKPEIVIWDNDVILTEGMDYTLTYKNNVNVSDGAEENKAPRIIIRGKGNYSEELEIFFDILPANIAGTDFVCEEEMFAKSTGKEQKPMPTLKWGKKKLSAKKDFTVSYLNEDGKEVKPSASGDYIIRIAGVGNFTGVREIPFTITEKSMIDKAKISSVAAQTYTGEEVTPEPVVKLGNETLVKDIDYTLEYRDNVDAGTAVILVRGIGSYSSIKQVNFKINGVLLSKVAVTKLDNVAYTGKKIEQKGVLRYNGETLVEGRDYTVSCTNNQKVGTASIVFTGKGKYTGTVKKTFKILAKDMTAEEEDFQVTFYSAEGTALESGKLVLPYTKGGVTPKIVVTDVKTGNVLKEKTDYVISYKNNKASGSMAVLTISGKKNYKGKLTREFSITQSDLSKLNVIVGDKKYSAKANGYKALPIIKDTNGKTLTAGVDYDKNIVYTYVQDTVLNDQITRAAGETVQSTDAVPIGTEIQMTIKGLGYYAGTSITAIYRIVTNVISGARVIVQDQMYTGTEITLNPDNDDIRVICNGKKLVYGEDYIIAGYENNVDKGKATVVLKGIGNYGGTKSVNFTIGTRKIFWWIF